jgi:hypothetical protein
MTYTLEQLNKMVDDANKRCGSLDLGSLTFIERKFSKGVSENDKNTLRH